MDLKKVLGVMSEAPGVSGHEEAVADIVAASCPWADEVTRDILGNLILQKKGKGGEPRPKLMLAAHMDEIGCMVTKIEEKGFLRFTTVGGFDSRIFPAQEVTVFGKKEFPGVIGAKPPHVQDPQEREQAVKLEDMFIDVGFAAKETAEQWIAIGDIITLRRPFLNLQGPVAAGKAMDDRASVGAMLECLKQLSTLEHRADVFAVATVQEEVGLRGATTSSFGLRPDVAVAIDVGFGDMPGLAEADTIRVGAGPGIAIGPHAHPLLCEKLQSIAKEWNVPFSLDPSPHPGGTDAFAIQTAGIGVPTILLSIPLRYMHTPVETVNYNDIKATGRLLALFAAALTPEFVEGLLCY